MNLLYPFCMQALEIIRGCRGLNLVGCDLVEVSPPYDTTGTEKPKSFYSDNKVISTEIITSQLWSFFPP